MQRMQNECMPSITIRNVPPDVRDELAARAARVGKSLQEHLRAELIDLARRPTVAELMDRARERARATQSYLAADEILADRNADRP